MPEPGSPMRRKPGSGFSKPFRGWKPPGKIRMAGAFPNALIGRRPPPPRGTCCPLPAGGLPRRHMRWIRRSCAARFPRFLPETPQAREGNGTNPAEKPRPRHLAGPQAVDKVRGAGAFPVAQSRALPDGRAHGFAAPLRVALGLRPKCPQGTRFPSRLPGFGAEPQSLMPQHFS